MSSCLILQDKNNFYIGADTACSVNIDGKYYRYSDNIEKIFVHGEDTYFCSGNVSIVNFINAWINAKFYQQSKIDIELLSNFLKYYCPLSNKDVFDVEIMVCRKENNVPKIYQLSQYNNYNPIVFNPRDNGINILCCGCKTQNVYNISKQILLNKYDGISNLYQNVFDSIYDNKVGGYVTLYANGRKILHAKIHENNIEYASNVEDCHLLIAEAVLSGYIEGSKIVGGTIQIGEQEDGTYAFEVHADGSVTMGGGSYIDGYVKEEDVDKRLQDLKTTIVSDKQPEDVEEGRLWLNTSVTPYELMVLTNGEWVYFSQQEGCRVFAFEPDEYSVGDLWIKEDGSIWQADENLNWVDATPTLTETLNNVQQYFEFNKETGLKIGQKDEKFYVNVSSTRMSFYDKSDEEDIASEETRDPDEVVYISNKSAVMKKLVVEGESTFEAPAFFNSQVNIYNEEKTSGIVWQMEQNGSFSLAIIS